MFVGGYLYSGLKNEYLKVSNKQFVQSKFTSQSKPDAEDQQHGSKQGAEGYQTVAAADDEARNEQEPRLTDVYDDKNKI